MVINTNQNAVEASNALQRNQAALSRSLARLSSGSKIINPSDDAAGLAVSEKIQAQTTRVEAARVNIQNTVSLLQTTDGFLGSMGQVLDRMSELAVLSLDVTKNPSDRGNYALEFDSLKDQLRDIIGNGQNGTDSDPNWNASSTEPAGTFNGISLFGARSDITVVVGASGDQTLKIGEINLREVGGALSNLLWDSSVDPSQTDIDFDADGVVAAVNEAILQVAGSRAEIGSVESRLNVVSAQLQVQEENMEAANSRIRDVDIARESTAYAKSNILMQSGTAMLAQANALPESVLRLLN